MNTATETSANAAFPPMMALWTSETQETHLLIRLLKLFDERLRIDLADHCDEIIFSEVEHTGLWIDTDIVFRIQPADTHPRVSMVIHLYALAKNTSASVVGTADYYCNPYISFSKAAGDFYALKSFRGNSHGSRVVGGDGRLPATDDEVYAALVARLKVDLSAVAKDGAAQIGLLAPAAPRRAMQTRVAEALNIDRALGANCNYRFKDAHINGVLQGSYPASVDEPINTGPLATIEIECATDEELLEILAVTRLHARRRKIAALLAGQADVESPSPDPYPRTVDDPLWMLGTMNAQDA